ncbi:MAG: hypothetical protein D6719_03705 [Candidatus Dadabacteria bacterium]|nr:MAG: hypothetical protein D6719_03705 [Candidatus Dadabacteria bacterium]
MIVILAYQLVKVVSGMSQIIKAGCLYLMILSAVLVPLCAAAEERDFLTAPSYLQLYQKPFSELNRRERWKIKKYGLRFAPLDPAVWAIRNFDRTDNRTIVPMRPYYLRASALKDFQAESIVVNFKFKRLEKQKEFKAPHFYDPVLDISFAGKYRRPDKLSLIDREEGYLVRLSAFTDFTAGFYYRIGMNYVLIRKLVLPQLETGKKYRAKLLISSNEATLFLNEQPVGSIEGKDLNSGLISLTTGWHPLKIDRLEIGGFTVNSGKIKRVKYSGLYRGQLTRLTEINVQESN